MATELVDIQPLELRFAFEVKKQSSCSIQLGNKSDQYVAFKVKTTSPTKYCVRPNIGIIKPKAARDFTVTMQAQKVAPPDLHCKDKFLVQSTVVPFGTAEEDITSNMFSKDSGKYVEEKKMRVILTSPPQSPVLLPKNGELKKDPYDTSMPGDIALSGIENVPPPHKVAEDVLGSETAKELDESKEIKGREELTAQDADLRQLEEMNLKPQALDSTKDVDKLKLSKDVLDPNLVKDFEELKSKLQTVDSKLREADCTILKLNDERSMAIREKDMLKSEVEMLRRKNSRRRIQVGFPLLYVCMVALISLVLGYLIHS